MFGGEDRRDRQSGARQSVLEAAGTPYPARRADEPFRLLVFGGSQGARFMSDLVPPAIAALPAETARA